MRSFVEIFRVVVLISFLGVIALAQTGPAPAATPEPQPGDDSDPSRPVVWSLREEYLNLPGKTWINAIIFRTDRAFLKGRSRRLGMRGILTRTDLPFVVTGRPDGVRAGLGDIYAQALIFPYIKGKFAYAGGSGISLPTATNRRLGTGKLTIAPIAAVVRFFPKR